MDAVKRTKILYDDPNSFFKAKSIEHLRNIVGSNLTTHTRTLSDIRMDTSRESIIQKLIINLQDIDSLLLDAVNVQLIIPSELSENVINYITEKELTHYDFIKFSKLLHLCNEVIGFLKQLIKLTGFNEEDIKILDTLYNNLNNQYEYNKNAIINFSSMISILTMPNVGCTINDINPMVEDITVDNTLDPIIKKTYNIFTKMMDELKVILQTKSFSTGTPVITVGGSRFGNVLSSHQQFIQQQPYKRFL